MPPTDNEIKSANQVIYRLINIRPRSEKEVKDKLTKKGFAKETTQASIEYFTKLGLLNDHTFAKLWISSRLSKPFGPYRIKLELKEKGVHPDIIDEELKNAYPNDEGEREIVYNLAKRRAKRFQHIEREKLRKRIYAYLLRRGFAADVVLKAIKKI